MLHEPLRKADAQNRRHRFAFGEADHVDIGDDLHRSLSIQIIVVEMKFGATSCHGKSATDSTSSGASI